MIFPLDNRHFITVVYIKDGEIKSGISKGSMLQSKYFYEIVQLNSEESLNIMK